MFRTAAAIALAISAAPIVAPALAHDGVTHDPNLPAATKSQIHAVAAAVQKYKDFRVAEAEGWKKFGGDAPLMGEHWYPPKELSFPDLKGSDAAIDWAKPSNLMYTEIGGRKVLTGVAFVVRLRDGEAVPEGFAGTADQWHVHDFPRAVAAATETRPVLRWLANWWLDANYRDKGDDRGRLAMVHAWVTLPNPDGVFADHNRLVPYLKLGLPQSFASAASASEAAARGLELATPRGCAEAVDGGLWIADAGAKSAKAVKAACTAAAGEVRQAIAQHGKHADMLNAAADQAYCRFDTVWQRELTPAQQARIAAITEHGEHHGAPVCSSASTKGSEAPVHDRGAHEHGAHDH